MTWDQYFILMARAAARKSKDPSTQVGAIVVDSDNVVRATGFNGFPRGVPDRPEEYANREVKYRKVLHAEDNAIMAAARVGVPLQGCRLYATLHPCFECAKRIIQCGIMGVYYPLPSLRDEGIRQRWAVDIADASNLMQGAGLRCRAVDMDDVEPVG